MSLIHNYLKKTEEVSTPSEYEDVPPVLKNINQKTSNRLAISLFSIAAAIIAASILIFIYQSNLKKIFLFANKPRIKQNSEIEKFQITSQNIEPYKILDQPKKITELPKISENLPPKPPLKASGGSSSLSDIKDIVDEPTGQKAKQEMAKSELPKPEIAKPEETKTASKKQNPAPKVKSKKATLPKIEKKDEEKDEYVDEEKEPDKNTTDKNTTDKNKNKKAKDIYQMGLISQKEGDDNNAQRFYMEVLKKDDKDLSTLTNLSAIYIQNKKYSEAEAIINKILSIDNRNTKAKVNLGVIYLDQHKYTQAKKLFKEAVQVNPSDESALVNLIYLAREENDIYSAENYFNKLIEISSTNYEIILVYASLMEKNNRIKEAINLYKKSLDLIKSDDPLVNEIKMRMDLLQNIISKQAVKR